MMTVALLIISLGSTEAPAAGSGRCWEWTALGKAPRNAGWPVGLPEAKKADGGAVMLEKPLADEVARRMTCLWHWPEACQSAIDAGAAVATSVAAERASQVREVIGNCSGCSDPGWPTWSVAVVGVASVVLGVLAGYGVASAVQQ